MTCDATRSVRVLYVEDDKNIQRLIAEWLTLKGFEVACADNGKLGIEKARQWHPDVILMDVRMPVMDGPDAIRHLRDYPPTAQTPIFVLSAYTDAKTRDTCERAGADGFFTKPPDFNKIIAAITAALKDKSR